jgi:hypothetical protein
VSRDDADGHGNHWHRNDDGNGHRHDHRHDESTDNDAANESATASLISKAAEARAAMIDRRE